MITFPLKLLWMSLTAQMAFLGVGVLFLYFFVLFVCFGLYSNMELFLAEPHGSRNQSQFKKSYFGEILSWKKWMLPSVAAEADLAHFEM